MKFEITKRMFLNAVNERTGNNGKRYCNGAFFDGKEFAMFGLHPDVADAIEPMKWYDVHLSVVWSGAFDGKGSYVRVLDLTSVDE